MERFYFTYGSNHYDIHGKSLGRRYTVVTAAGFWEARSEFFKVRGLVWSLQYTEKDFAGQAEQFGLTEIAINEVKLLRDKK